ncbi:MAG: hydantoinase/oxoprolinase family protein [Acidibacillus sp.]|uniref:Acetone carboxylase beta subunit n=1 Tax=Sulfoacidibacillus ferrooxidans TaxID=2005001 RepID=A0A9X1V967_9BACL|nr:hydantoinase/oxoprolinase family protein [Sulfoacidibacillus ferrooxidans]MCI0183510.1 Acetone carboxylase beta subunit [Sulfoacidibacillus ferrooxidans]MCY0891990.1 hydantoinase/oxoprolinase family protein [Acidibacillus sp.]
MNQHDTKILAIDTGGTMTDTILIDTEGQFVVGKSQTTPDAVGEGIMHSLRDASKQWDLTISEVASRIEMVVYTGTLMLNRIISRTGTSPIGVLTSAGFEDTLRFGRARQSWHHLSLQERLHAVSHFHPEPLVAREFIHGVRERILPSGHEMIPLYEEDVREATEHLIDQGAKAIVICYLNSFIATDHEIRSEQLVQEVLDRRGVSIPIFLSHKVHPIIGEAGRINSVVIQVYAAEPSRVQLKELEGEFRNQGSSASVRLLTNYGTTVSTSFDQMIHTVNSGPTGGVLGSKFLGKAYDIKYMLATDVGGTTFDVGTILNGDLLLRDTGMIDQFLVNTPMVAVDSIGSGTGSYVRVDPVTQRVRLGPDSAGYRVGVCVPASGVDTVTVNDANLILGYLNPDNFLGGQVKLDRERAIELFTEQVAKPLGVDVYEAAWGVHQLTNLTLKLHLQQVMLGMGFGPEIFHVAGYGGGGPLHVIGYTDGLNLAGVMIPSWAPGFSAFGAACGEYGMRQEISTDLFLPPPANVKPKGLAKDVMQGAYGILPLEVKSLVDAGVDAGSTFEQAMGMVLNMHALEKLGQLWNGLLALIVHETEREGLSRTRLRYVASVRMRYAGMLDDLEVTLDHFDLTKGLDGTVLMQMIEIFEESFDKVYARAARSTDFGYQITRVILSGYYDSIAPTLMNSELCGQDPKQDTVKETRSLYWGKEMMEAHVYDMELVKPGNVLVGPCLVESSATTLLVPPHYRVYMDRKHVFWVVRPQEQLEKYLDR